MIKRRSGGPAWRLLTFWCTDIGATIGDEATWCSALLESIAKCVLNTGEGDAVLSMLWCVTRMIGRGRETPYTTHSDGLEKLILIFEIAIEAWNAVSRRASRHRLMPIQNPLIRCWLRPRVSSIDKMHSLLRLICHRGLININKALINIACARGRRRRERERRVNTKYYADKPSSIRRFWANNEKEKKRLNKN